MPPDAPSRSEDSQTRTWAMALHLSQFAGYLIPLAGLLAPIIIWQVKKTELPGIDEHGRIVVNWILSSLIYAIVSSLLIFLLVGFPLLIILAVLLVAFPIIGAVKASSGIAWRYPLSIPFLG